MSQLGYGAFFHFFHRDYEHLHCNSHQLSPAHTHLTDIQECSPYIVTMGVYCWKQISHAFDHAQFRIYQNIMFVNNLHVKVLKNGQTQYRVVAFY